MMGGPGGFSDFFQTMFGGGARPRGTNASGAFGGFDQTARERPRRSRDVEQPVEITLEEAFHGTARILQREDGSRIEVKIPRGVTSGSRCASPAGESWAKDSAGICT